MELLQYDQQLVRITTPQGKVFTGIAEVLSPEHGLREWNREGESVRVGHRQIFKEDIIGIEALPEMKILRATEIWQQAGAYYVRIQAMARKHHISLRQEFDEHDTPETRYIVITDQDFPVATARMYPLDETRMMIGRVVVLPEYRHQGIGSMTVLACEEWAAELGYRTAVLDSRDNKTDFYEQLGYEICDEAKDGDTFRCVRMKKELP